MADANCTRTEGRNAKYVRAYRARKAAGLPKVCSSEPSANDRGRAKKLIHCAGCHAEYWRVIRGSKDSGKYCSRGCYERLRADVSRERSAIRRIAANWRKTEEKAKPDPATPGSGASIVPCCMCGIEFDRPRFMWPHRAVCSDACRERRDTQARVAWRSSDKARECRRVIRARRRAIERGAKADRIDPMAVFERDKWLCHICGAKTIKSKRGTRHPLAPELDHIVTLADGGQHVWGNVACACCACNADKGAKSLGQLGLGFAA